jgi:nucleotide-binding universal stress UspA family protein
MPGPRRFSITCGIDLSEYSPIVLMHLFDEAGRRGGVDCHVVTVVPDRSGRLRAPTPSEQDAARLAAKRRLVELVHEAHEDLDVSPAQRAATWLHVRCGIPEQEIIGVASEAGSDLIVVGRFGARAIRIGLNLRGRLGSVADRLLAEAECPVLVVQGASYAPGQDAAQQCADCARVRAASRGETWFCARHHSDWVLHGSTVVVGEGVNP